ncbi:MAG: cytochrome C assembly family protein [Thiolinea sp.]
MIITITLLTILAWASTWSIIAVRLKKQAARQPDIKLLNIIWPTSLILHGILLLHPLITNNILSFSLLSSLSTVMWISGLILYLAHLKRPLETMGLFIIPFIILSIVSALIDPKISQTINLQHGLGLHILFSLLAYSMLALATLQALLLAVQNKHLHNHKPNGLIKTLPPLQDMESLLFQLIIAGVILLTLGLITGFIFLDGLFGKQVAHKTILSMIAWLTFSTLLIGHWRYGWRGKIAIRWTITGFTFLMLAFWGSKFVLEYLVKIP